jgi:uncharacterized protein
MEIQPDKIVREIRRGKGSIATLDGVTKVLVKAGIGVGDASRITQSLSLNLSRVVMPAVTKLELLLTEECNLRCDYCFAREKDHASMNPATACRAVDFLIEQSRDKNELSVLFFGGEPLLEYPLIKETVLHIRDREKAFNKRIHLNMTTNGALLDDDSLHFFNEHRLKFLLSIDGRKQTHDRHRLTAGGQGTFDGIMARLPLMKKYQPWLGTKMTVLPDTVGDLSENVRYLYEAGINQFLLGPADGIQWSRDAVELFGEEVRKIGDFYRREKAQGRPIRVNLCDDLDSENFFGKRDVWGCRAGRHSLTISPAGEIFPCSKMYANPALRKSIRLGTLQDGITDPLVRMRLIGMIPVDRGGCATCTHSRSCAGGCFAVNYLETGDIFKPSRSFECAFHAVTADIAAKGHTGSAAVEAN